jgi:sulfur carrier protein
MDESMTDARTIRVTANGRPLDLAAPATVSDLVAALALAGRRFALERNGEIVPRSRHADTALADGDRIEIVHAVGGG